MAAVVVAGLLSSFRLSLVPYIFLLYLSVILILLLSLSPLSFSFPYHLVFLSCYLCLTLTLSPTLFSSLSACIFLSFCPTLEGGLGGKTPGLLSVGQVRGCLLFSSSRERHQPLPLRCSSLLPPPHLPPLLLLPDVSPARLFRVHSYDKIR